MLNSPTLEPNAASPRIQPPQIHSPSSLFANQWLAPALIFALAVLLRMHALTIRSFWFDEGFTIGIARLDWTNFAQIVVRREGNMVLYYLLLRLWLLLAHGEAFIRSLSVIVGVGGVGAVYWSGRRLFNQRVGAVAALLLAVNAFHIHYSQEARSYALVLLLVTLSSIYFIDAMRDQTARSWRWYTVWSILAVYAHFFAGLVVVAQWTSLLFLPRRQVPWARFFTAVRIFGYAMVPVAASAMALGDTPIGWVPRLTPAGLRETLLEFAGSGGWTLVVLLSVAIFAALMLRWHATGLQDRLTAWPYALLACWLVLPFAIAIAASTFHPTLVTRYMTICLPPMVLLAAAGLDRLPIAPRLLMLTAIVGLSLQGTFNFYTAPIRGHDDWRAASQYVLANAAPQDGVFFYTGQGKPSFEYYRWLANRPLDLPLAICPMHSEPYRELIAEPLAELLPTAASDRPRVWLVLGQYINRSGKPDMGSAAVRGWLVRQKNYRLVSDTLFDGIDVALYVQQSTTPVDSRQPNLGQNKTAPR